MGIQQGLGYRGRGEGIGLDKDLLPGLSESLIDCISAAPVRTEIDLDGGVLGEGEVSGMSGLKGNQKNDEQKGSKDTLHGLALLCDTLHAPELWTMLMVKTVNQDGMNVKGTFCHSF